MNDNRNGDWIQTYTGKMFWPVDPRTEEIFIEDIAHALSLLCRFGGHVRRFYSVAEHSVRVSQAVPDDCALWGLLHDATEAYLVDLPRPIKRHSSLGTEYLAIEGRLLEAVATRFGLVMPEPEYVHAADAVLLRTEQRDLMGPQTKPWECQATPLPERIEPWSPRRAEQRFLNRFYELLPEEMNG